MYEVIELVDGSWYCYGRVQDGTESWAEATLEASIKSMISFARTANGVKITRSNITITRYKPPPDRLVSEEDWQLLQKIKARRRR